MPSPADAKNVIELAMRKPGGVGSLGSVLEQAARVAAEAAGEAAVGVEGAEAVSFIDAVTAVIEGSVGWILVLGLAGLIVNLKLIEVVAVKICDAIPFGLGSGPRGLITLIYRPIDNLEAWVGQRMADIATNTILDIIHAFRMFWQFQVGTVTTPSSPVTQSQIHALQNEIDADDAKIRHLTVLYNELAAQVHGSSLPSTSTTTLNERVTRLERLMIPFAHDLNALHNDVTRLDHNYNVDHRELQALQTNLNAVRAVQFNVQDVLNEVQNGVQYVEYELGVLAPQVDAHARTLHILSPLQGLLYLGQPGLKNLEKLERNPCQCPQLPELPGDQAAFLALYEFITNG